MSGAIKLLDSVSGSASGADFYVGGGLFCFEVEGTFTSISLEHHSTLSTTMKTVGVRGDLVIVTSVNVRLPQGKVRAVHVGATAATAILSPIQIDDAGDRVFREANEHP